jgi:hypothetical protein
MKGIITENGILCIFRKRAYIPQKCMHKQVTESLEGFYGLKKVTTQSECSDGCPLFGEPDKYKLYNSVGQPTGKTETRITICQDRVLYFTEFEDHRKEKNEAETQES